MYGVGQGSNSKATAEGNLLHWKTANERDFSGFEVQRANDGKKLNFQPIAFVNGTQSINYQYTDNAPQSVSTITG